MRGNLTQEVAPFSLSWRTKSLHTLAHNTHGEQVDALPGGGGEGLGRGISGVCVKSRVGKGISGVTFHRRREEGNEKDHGSYPELHSDG